MASSLDLILVGGGLSNGLFAYALSKLRPDVRFLLLEKQDRLGGCHTWSFHDSDVLPEASWIRPLISQSWPSHQVYFPNLQRRLNSPYHSIRSSEFHEKLMAQLGSSVRLNTQVVSADDTRVTLTSGEALTATAVIDGRGFVQGSARSAFQKFVGLDVRLEAPHGLAGPILIDATVLQEDGFRFFYCLPWSETECLIEDTHYSDTSDIDTERYLQNIRGYAIAKGWKIAEERGREQGALAIPLHKAAAATSAGPMAMGTRAGNFHPTTGYSLPDAARLVSQLIRHREWSPNVLRRSISEYGFSRRSSRSYFRFLNRMMFFGAKPQKRYRILEHFYRLPDRIIQSFYSGEISLGDGLRILLGKPPIPVYKVAQAIVIPGFNAK